MELTLPRSPTISRAIAAYVVSDVTTLTGAGGVPSCIMPTCRPRISSVILVSMSVGLMFMGTDAPNGLQRELTRRVHARQLLPSILTAEEHPFALPESERGDDLAGD